MQAETKLRGQNIHTGEQGTLLCCRDSQCGVKEEGGGPLFLVSSSLEVLSEGGNVRKIGKRERGAWGTNVVGES